MCMYHVSLQTDYGFCCELDDECAKKLAGNLCFNFFFNYIFLKYLLFVDQKLYAGVPGVISVRLDENVDTDNKDYGGILIC